MTLLVHGASELERVEKATQALFGTEIRTLDARTLREAFSGAPSTSTSRDKLSGGYPLIDALVDTGLCASKGAARKEIQAGGIYVNNERIQDPALVLMTTALLEGGIILLRKGKKNYHLLTLS